MRPLGLALLMVIAAAALPVGAAAAAVDEARLPSGDVTLFVTTLGSPRARDTLVLIPGGPGASHHYMAGMQARLAATGRRVVLYDPAGTGQSTEPPGGAFTRQGQVADIEAIRRRTGARRIHVVGHSFGGLLAQDYAIAHPEHLASLILVDSVPPTNAALTPTFQKLVARLGQLMAAGVIHGFPPAPEGRDGSRMFRHILPGYFADPAFAIPPELELTRYDSETSTRMNAAYKGYDNRAGLATVRVPVLIVAGDADPFRESMAELAAAFPAAAPRSEVMPKCGHMPWVECPEAFYPVVEDFLRSGAAQRR
jgi:proline iminopeptidase